MRNIIAGFWQKFKTREFLVWTAVFLTAFIPLFFKFPVFFVGGTFVTVRLEDFILLGVYLLLGYHYISGNKPVLSQRLLGIFGLFFVLGLLSVGISAFGFGYLNLPLGLLHWARRIEYMGIFFLGLILPFSRKQLQTIIIVSLSVSFLVSIYALGQKYWSFPVVSTINSELSKGLVYTLTPFDRVSSTFSGHYDLAGYLLMQIPLAVGVLVYLWPSWNSLVLLMLTSLNFYILVLTAARLSFLSLIVSTLTLLVFLKKWRWLAVAVVLFGLSLVYPSELRNRLLATVRVNIQRSWDSYQAKNEVQEVRSRLNIPTLPADNKKFDSVGVNSADIVPGEPTNTTDLGVFRSLDIRLQVEWPKAWQAFWRNPITGMGYSSLGLATDNDWLRALGETGLLGLSAFGIIIVLIFNLLWVTVSGTPFFVSRVALSILVGFLINSIFIDVFEASKLAILFWLYMGVAIGYVQRKNEK